MNLADYQFALVLWWDINSDNAWTEEPISIIFNVTVGWIIYSDDTQIKMIATAGLDHDAFSEQVAIPRGCIDTTFEIKLPKRFVKINEFARKK
jgi:hypothetical protein